MLEYRIACDRLAVTIRAHGAEPISLLHADAGELLWQAGPAWPKHAPVLFPIVGELRDDRYRYDGRSYELGRHGFARERDFSWTETGPRACTLTLRDDERTRAVYPFPFELAIRYVVAGDSLRIIYTLRNPGERLLHASLGAHPAFRWPLADGVAKTDHLITFEREEPSPVRRLRDNLLSPLPEATPVKGRELRLEPALFAADALIFDALHSSSLRYAAPGAPQAPALELAWTGFAQLGLWSKSGADFVCIEPWYGYASPQEFDGDFSQKPGLLHVPAGEMRTFSLEVAVVAPRARA